MAYNGIQGIVLITGAAGGIGREVVFSFAEAGVSGVVLADVDEKGAQEAAEKSREFARHSGYSTLVVHVDVTDAASVEAMVDAAVQRFGRIDYNINCAGVGPSSTSPVADVSIEELDRLMAINVKGTLLCVRAVTKAMIKQEPLSIKGRNGLRSLGRGSIVNLGSANSYVALAGKAPYTISKHAVMGITKTAALDNAPHGIRVNAVCPSWVEGPMMDREFKMMPPLREIINSMAPLGRIAQPEEVGGVVVFLCSPDASYINGIGLMVDGGLTLTSHI